MSAKQQNLRIAAVGVAACAACCAGPIVAFLAAIGLGTAIGAALWGAGALIIGALVAVVVVRRRRRRAAACTVESAPVAVAAPTVRSKG